MSDYVNWHKWWPIVRSLRDKGMDLRDIAEETGLSLGAVRRKLRDGDVQGRKSYSSSAVAQG